MSTVFIEKLLHFSKAGKGIENSNTSYYYALGMIEEALYTGGVNKYTPWNVDNNSVGDVTLTGKSITILTGWATVPLAGQWNSPYDVDWNILSLGDPAQLVIPDGVTWNTVRFQFRIPKMDNSQTSTGIHTSLTNSGIILWTLTSADNSLFASGETNIFRWSDINGNLQSIVTKNGTTSTGSLRTFENFYNLDLWAPLGQDCSGYACTFKLSMIRPVVSIDNINRQIPFVEYRITGFNTMIPQKFMNINAQWYAYGFTRSRSITLPQITTNNTLDFAVVQ